MVWRVTKASLARSEVEAPGARPSSSRQRYCGALSPRAERLVHTRSKHSLNMLELVTEKLPGVVLTHDSILTYSQYVRNLTYIV